MGRGPPAYRGQGLEQAVEGRVPEAAQGGEGGQEPQEEVGQGNEGCAAQHPVEAQPGGVPCSTRMGGPQGPGATLPSPWPWRRPGLGLRVGVTVGERWRKG